MGDLMKIKFSVLLIGITAMGLAATAFFEVRAQPKPCPAHQRCYNPIDKSVVKNTFISRLPKGKPTCCEHEWTVRINHYHPGAVAPRRMYFASCRKKSDSPEMFISLALGKNAKHEMWMFEWKNGDLHSRPKKFVIHRAMNFDWEYGNNYLRMGNDGTYDIAVKARVYGGGGCHEADALICGRNGSKAGGPLGEVAIHPVCSQAFTPVSN